MTKPAATRPCRICKQAVPRWDWPTPPNPIVCDACARTNQTRPRPT